MEAQRGRKKDDSAKTDKVAVAAPPITQERLEQYLTCEADVLELLSSRFGRLAEAYLDSSHGKRMRGLAEAESTGQALGQALRGVVADQGKETTEVKEKLQQAEEESRKELEDRVKSCGFASIEEWEAFGARIQPVRRWRLNKEIHDQSRSARAQMKAQLDQAVETGRMTEAQRDTAIAAFPEIEDPELPVIEPPLSQEEIDVVRSADVQMLVPGGARSR